MARKAGKGEVPDMKLGRSGSRLFAKPGAAADATRVIIRAGGKIKEHERPTKLRGRRNDVVLWFCENKSGEKISIEIDFRPPSKENGPSPIDFLSPNPLPIANRDFGIIVGKINRGPKLKRLPELVHYSIFVTGNSFGTVEHDPDLEIKP